ncbi:hypothetical protein K438DRAFT_1784629 [Mycena galopus ATCC 62051]|nr:hypothetical protein K438DRAFT_1784629 [Mycena galopus ATCC 62051]
MALCLGDHRGPKSERRATREKKRRAEGTTSIGIWHDNGESAIFNQSFRLASDEGAPVNEQCLVSLPLHITGLFNSIQQGVTRDPKNQFNTSTPRREERDSPKISTASQITAS